MDKLYFEEKGPGILERIGMSKAEFARRMGVKRQNVNALFKSRKIETIRQAADVMGVPFEMLIGYASEPELGAVTPEEGNKPTSISIENRIYTVRGEQVMIDLDLSELYGVENRSLHQAVKRNIDKFPEDFLLILTRNECNELIDKGVSRTVIPPGYNTGGSSMYAFTEQGVAMLATILRSKNATSVSIAIMRAFVAMRRFLITNARVFERLDHSEQKQQESEEKIVQLFNRFNQNNITPSQGIFFDGQIYDAYSFVSKLIREANKSIRVIDNYVNDEVLTMLDKRNPHVTATIYTKGISRQLKLDLNRHNAQYEPINVVCFGKSHDRFLIIDDQVYHIGASLKDLGKKWFAFSRMEDLSPSDLVSQM